MNVLHPPIKPYAQHMLSVQEPHEIYVEESGNPDGIPVLFVHGGPGAGCTPDDRRFFSPAHYRIILFDQRGCGHSTPHASIKNNDTQATLDDMETIRKNLKIDRWVLFGGSWGSTLSLLYAQKNSETVLGLILRGIFLSREQDIRWFFQEGASNVFPEFWEQFVSPIPEDLRENIIEAYYKRLKGDDELARMNAAKHWSQWEAHCATLNPNRTVVERVTNPHTAMSLALTQTHYFSNNGFVKPDQILRDVYKLEGIPGTIVHGRYDMVCRFDNAYALQRAWPGSELYAIRDAGHSASEPGICDALIHATERMALSLQRT